VWRKRIYSFCTVRSDAVPRYVSFAETVRAIWRRLRGVRPDWRQRFREAKLVADLAEVIAVEMEGDAETSLNGIIWLRREY
jgi:hypothetical protein